MKISTKTKKTRTFTHRITITIEGEEVDPTVLSGMAEEAAAVMLEGCSELRVKAIGVEWVPGEAPHVYTPASAKAAG